MFFLHLKNMSYNTNTIPTIRTIKARRGESLTIDLGKTLTGTISAWMKKDPNDTTYRSFEIVSARFLFLTQDKASDYLNEAGSIVEAIQGKWYFDVRQILNVAEPEKVKTIFTGVIYFSDNVTGSNGVELLNPIIGLLPYDNTVSGLTSTNIKDAIDELAALLSP